MLFWSTLTFLSLLCAFAWADETKSTSVEDNPPLPIISESGYKRVQNTLRSVDENVIHATENLRVIEKNIQTLENEQRTLDKLEEEHHDLKKRYDRYFSYADEELKKNNVDVQELEQWETAAKSSASADTSERVAKMNSVQQEKNRRKDWDKDAKSKVERVRVLDRGLAQNLELIREKRPDIQSQLAYWKDEFSRHQSLLRELAARKKEIEELVAKH